MSEGEGKPTDRWPLDFAALEKGTWLGTAQLERATRKPCTHPDFLLACMSLVKVIEKEALILGRTDGRGAGLRVRLMTDAEAVTWNAKQARHHLGGLTRAAHRTVLIDRSQLSDEERAEHDHEARKIQGMAIAAAEEKRRYDRMLRAQGADAPVKLLPKISRLG